MEKEPDVDLPPPYSALIQTPETADVSENGAAPLDSSNTNSFENKNARVVFIQKVLSIFLMQTVAVDLVLEIIIYVRIFKCVSENEGDLDLVGFLWGSIAFYIISIALLITCYQTRHKIPFNYVILVYQPVAVCVIAVFVLRATLGLNIMTEDILEMISLAWKAYIFSSPVILLYSVFCLDSQHELRLGNCILIATGVFGVTSLCIMPYASKIWNGPIAVFSTIAVLYPTYLYILYDIVAMTRPDYHETMTPADYANGAVNLSFDIFIIIKNYIERICTCRCTESVSSPEVIV